MSEYDKARREAFSWYGEHPPSADAARRYFAEKASRDRRNAHIYGEAFRLFLATCWPGQSARG